MRCSKSKQKLSEKRQKAKDERQQAKRLRMEVEVENLDPEKDEDVTQWCKKCIKLHT
jgi:hypothetical protein